MTLLHRLIPQQRLQRELVLLLYRQVVTDSNAVDRLYDMNTPHTKIKRMLHFRGLADGSLLKCVFSAKRSTHCVHYRKTGWSE